MLLKPDRMMKHLAAMKMIKEVDVDEYRPTALSLALTEPRYRDNILFPYEARFTKRNLWLN
jgi:hypothetical protein